MKFYILSTFIALSFAHTPTFANWAQNIEINYKKNTTATVMKKIQQVTKQFKNSDPQQLAKDQFDLAQLAYQLKKSDISAYWFLQAHLTQPNNSFYLAWVTHSVFIKKSFTQNDLIDLETKLSKALEPVQSNYLKEEAQILSKQKQQRHQISSLQKDFQKIKTQMLKLHKQNKDDPNIKNLGQKLTLINQEIQSINESMIQDIKDLRRPTDFELRVLSKTQSEIAELATHKNTPEGEAFIEKWLQKAEQTLLLGQKQKVRPFARDFKSLGQLRLKQAQFYNKKYRNHRRATHKNPLYSTKKQLEDLLNTTKALLPKLEASAKSKYQNSKSSPAFAQNAAQRKALNHTLNQLKPQLDQASSQLKTSEALVKKLRKDLRNQQDPQRREALQKQEKQAFNDYQKNWNQYKKSTANYNRQVQKLRKLQKNFNRLNSQAHSKAYKNYNNTINKINKDIIPKLNSTNIKLQKVEEKWKDALWNRDQFLALGKSSLLKGHNNNPLDEKSGQIFQKQQRFKFKNLFGDQHLYTRRPWCGSISLNCGRCFGLAVLGCEFRQMDLRSACHKGQPYIFSTRKFGNGGLIGACGGRILVREKDNFAYMNDEDEGLNYGQFLDYLKRNKAQEQAKKMVSSLFNENQEQQPKDLDDLIKSLDESTSQEHQDLANTLRQMQKNRKLSDNWNVDELLDALNSETDPNKRKNLFTDVFDQILEAATQFTEMTSVDELSIEDGERISNSLKYGATLLDDLDDPTGLSDGSKLTGALTAVHGLTALASGTKNRDAEKIMDGVRDTLATAGLDKTPIGAVVDIPGEVAAAMINNTRKGWDQTNEAMSELNNAISGDPQALDRLENISRDLQKTLSPKAYGESMLNAIKNRIVDKVPFVRTLVNWFSGSDDD